MSRAAWIPLALLALAAPAAAAPWSQLASYHVPDDWSAAPRAAIAADGTAAVAWVDGPRLFAASGRANGRFGSRRALGRWAAAVPAVAAAPGGRALVAWEGTRGIRVALRTGTAAPWVLRTVARSNGSAISGLAVVRSPLGGWWFAESEFLPGPESHFRVRTFALDAAGRRITPVRRIDAGGFGADARLVHVLDVDATGRMHLAYERIAADGDIGVVTAGTRALLPASGPLSDPWTSAGPDGTAFVAATGNVSCGDAGCTGRPLVWRVERDGQIKPLGGPALAHPGRALQPSVAALPDGRAVLVFLLKPHAEAFRRTGRVRAVVLGRDGRAGRLQALTSADVSEPVALPLSRGRTLAVWSGSRRVGVALAGPSGRFAQAAGPPGPPPTSFHTNPTNRDVRTAGSWAIVAWARGLRVRVVARRFP